MKQPCPPDSWYLPQALPGQSSWSPPGTTTDLIYARRDASPGPQPATNIRQGDVPASSSGAATVLTLGSGKYLLPSS